MTRMLTIAAAIGLAAVTPQQPDTPPAPTRVVHFTPAKNFTGPTSTGVCQRSLLLDRDDAFRCTAAQTTYDPCFGTDRRGGARCGVDPRDAGSGILVEFTPAVSPAAPTRGAAVRAWFFELEDGSTCRPLVFGDGREVDGMFEIYTCHFAPPGADAVLGEIDSSARVLTIQQAQLNKRMPPLSIKQLASAAVKTAWQ